jgi:hypothetical protein
VITPASASSRVALWLVLLGTSALIVLRSVVFLQYEQADFDADQAIVGLMAKHLSEGRAWPLFFYGQLYMMGVQAWMAAPVFLWLGPTVLALKLPLLVINVLTGGLLVWLLVREVGLRPWQAGVATLFFAALPPVTASRLVQAQGGTIEPLFYAVLLWMARGRPVVFGLVFAFGFLQREFTLFAVAALVGLEVWTRELFDRRRLAHWLVVGLVFLGAREGVGLLRGQASMFGPQTAPVALDAAVTNVDVVASSVCPTPGNIIGNLAWLLRENVPTYFGVKRQPAGAFIASARPSGAGYAWPLVVIAFGMAGVLVLSRLGTWWAGPRPPDAQGHSPRFAWFLLATGVLSLAGVAVGCNVRSLITIRYHLMLALAPVGLVALAFAYARHTLPRRHDWRRVATATMAGATLAWAVAMAASSGALLREYRRLPPPDPFRVLADDLVAHGESVGWASYWVSYHVDFLAEERVILSPTAPVRIIDYARRATRAGRDAVIVADGPCEDGRQVAQWYVCPQR